MKSSRGNLMAAAVLAACAFSAPAFDAAASVWSPASPRQGFKPRKRGGSHKANARKQAKSRNRK